MLEEWDATGACDLNEDGLKATLEQLEGEKEHIIITGNLCDEEFLKQMAVDVPELDGVFLCAGVSDTTLAKFYTREKIDRVLNVNVIAPAMMLRYLLGKKKINKGDSLVWMSSAGAEEVEPGLGIYAASKSAVNGLIRTYAKELLGRKIRSNSIMPMMIKTEQHQSAQHTADHFFGAS